MSKIKVNEIEKASGSGITIPTGTSFTITDGLAIGSVPTITQAKIDNEAINEAKLQVSNAPTNGYFLQAQSGNTGGLTWAESTSGASVLLQTQTVSSSTGSVTFVNGTGGTVIDSTYNLYRLVITDQHSSAQEVIRCRVLVSGSENSSSNYSYASQGRRQDGNEYDTQSDTDTSWRFQARNYPNSATTQNAVTDVLFSFIAGRYAACRASSFGWNGNNELANERMGGAWKQTSTVNGIKIFPSSGTFEKGTFSFYGIKK